MLTDNSVPQGAPQADLTVVGSVQPARAACVVALPGVASVRLDVWLLSGGSRRPGPHQVPQPQRVLPTKPPTWNPTN